HRDRHLPVPHPRAFRHGRLAGARRSQRGPAVIALVDLLSGHGITLILAIPFATAVLMLFLPGYRLSARLNAGSALLTLLAALTLFIHKPAVGDYLLVDDLNIVFIVLNTFVGFTAALFSASYIGHELEIGRLTTRHLRFYHAMYQILLFGMNLALLANNI